MDYFSVIGKDGMVATGYVGKIKIRIRR